MYWFSPDNYEKIRYSNFSVISNYKYLQQNLSIISEEIDIFMLIENMNMKFVNSRIKQKKTTTTNN